MPQQALVTVDDSEIAPVTVKGVDPLELGRELEVRIRLSGRARFDNPSP
jgi:hypothetical protein